VIATIAERTGEAVAVTALAADLRDGIVSWQEWNPELTCAQRQDTAVEEAADAALSAWESLEAAERWVRAHWWRRLANWCAPWVADWWFRRGQRG
jgi:hypothetical protein